MQINLNQVLALESDGTKNKSINIKKSQRPTQASRTFVAVSHSGHLATCTYQWQVTMQYAPSLTMIILFEVTVTKRTGT